MNIFRIFTDTLAIITTAAPYIIQAQASDAPGADKRAEVVAKIVADIEAPEGIDFPPFLPKSMEANFVSTCIEVGVFLFKKVGGAEIVKK